MPHQIDLQIFVIPTNLVGIKTVRILRTNSPKSLKSDTIAREYYTYRSKCMKIGTDNKYYAYQGPPEGEIGQGLRPGVTSFHTPQNKKRVESG